MVFDICIVANRQVQLEVVKRYFCPRMDKSSAIVKGDD